MIDPLDDEISRLMQSEGLDGLDFIMAKESIADLSKALRKIAAVMADKEYQGEDGVKLAKAFASVVKGMDEWFRLMQFAKGRPDSRPDLSAADLLAVLTDEEARSLMARLEAKGR